MRKIFTMILMVFAVMAANAQNAIVVLDNSADVWHDGTGYQLLIDADNAGWAGTRGPDCGSQYDQWEYTIPANAWADDAAVVIGVQMMEIPAGTYSYLILNPGCDQYSANYIAASGVDPANASDFTFEAGKMYTFTMAMNGDNDCVRITVADIPTGPSIVAEESIDFGITFMQSSRVLTTNIRTYNLTAPVTATATAPFEVSADGVTFGATAQISVTPAEPAELQAGEGTLYIRYTPTVEANENGTITLTSTTATATIAVTGLGYVLNPVFPYECDFEGAGVASEWSFIQEGQTNAWYIGTAAANTGNGLYISNDNGVNNAYTNTAASGTFANHTMDFAAGTYTISFDWMCNGENNYDFMRVLLIPTSIELGAGAALSASAMYTDVVNLDNAVAFSGSTSWQTYTSEFIVPEDGIYNLSFYWRNDGSLGTNPPAAVDNIVVSVVSCVKPENLAVSGVTLTEATLTWAAGEATAWEVELNGGAPIAVNNTPSYTFENLTSSTTYTVRVRTRCSEEDVSSWSETLTFSTACEAVALPFTENFEAELACWTLIDADGDGYNWYGTLDQPEPWGRNNSQGAYVSNSYVNNVGAVNPDNYLITPQLVIPAEGAHMSWFVAAQDPDWTNEYYEVMVSTTTAEAASFTSVFSETLASGEWEERNVDLTDYAGQNIYVAFRHTNTTDIFAMKIDDVNVQAGVGINEEAAATTTRIYPNPATTTLNVEAAGFNKVEIVNVLGQVVYTSTMTDNAQINVSNLNNGVYFVRLNGESGTATQKFIKK